MRGCNSDDVMPHSKDLGYNVQLYGKMDTGGSVCRTGIDICQATGYHDKGNWSTKHKDGNVPNYYPGDLLHSWAASATIEHAIFEPLNEPNKWINLTHAGGTPFPTDWPNIQNCVDYVNALGGGSALPFALYCSVLDPHPPYFTNATWLAKIDDNALDATINASRWQPLEFVHPADKFQFTAEGVPADFNLTLARRLARVREIVLSFFSLEPRGLCCGSALEGCTHIKNKKKGGGCVLTCADVC